MFRNCLARLYSCFLLKLTFLTSCTQVCCFAELIHVDILQKKIVSLKKERTNSSCKGGNHDIFICIIDKTQSRATEIREAKK